MWTTVDWKNWHRSKFFELIRENGRVYIDDDKKDEYVPGLHLYNNHGLKNFDDFDNTFDVTLLKKCTPSNLDVKEHFWIQKLRTLNPLGPNLVDPYGLPLLQ